MISALKISCYPFWQNRADYNTTPHLNFNSLQKDVVSFSGNHASYREISKKRKTEIDELLDRFGVSGDNYCLIDKALTHKSYTSAKKISPLNNNQRLEFLGDAVLEVISRDYLVKRLPNYPEDVLKKINKHFVKNSTLPAIAKQIGLGKYLTLSRSVEADGGRNNEKILADAFEALIGALYLDGKFDELKKVLQAPMEDSVNSVLKKTETPPVSQGINEQNTNQSLEFLGYGVLKFLINDYLYKKYPDYSESDLTNISNTLSDNDVFAELVTRIDPQRNLDLNTNREESIEDEMASSSSYGRAIRASSGALYQEGKMKKLQKTLKEVIESKSKEIDFSKFKYDYTWMLRNYLVSAGYKIPPEYKLSKAEGSLDDRTYKFEVSIPGCTLSEPHGEASGKLRKAVKQMAARSALKNLGQPYGQE